MSKKNISRRELLKLTGLTSLMSSLSFDAFGELYKTILRGQVNDSVSKSLGNKLNIHQTRNFIQFNLFGAPSRWFFDCVLRPSDQDIFLPCDGVYNRFSEINSNSPHLTKGIYSDVKLKGINMPHLWQYEVARAGGGTRPMTDLMDHMLTIRGCDTKSEAHRINNIKLVTPSQGMPSITGLVADASRAFIPAISVGQTPANRAYMAPNLTSVIEIPSENNDYISYLLEAFYKNNEMDSKNKFKNNSSIENAKRALYTYGMSNSPGSEFLYKERNRAEELLLKGAKNLGDAFGPLVAKYEDLFQRSMFMSHIPNVNDQSIPGINFPITVQGEQEIEDALITHHHEDYILGGEDIRLMYKKALSQNLAKHFAIAEFAITEGLSSSILLSPPRERGSLLLGLSPYSSWNVDQIDKIYNKEKNTTVFDLKTNAKKVDVTNFIPYDSHVTGWITNIVSCSLFYKGLSACLIELIDQLKNKPLGNGTLFDETVIQVATEFGRRPDRDQGGYSHNSSSNVTSFFSGIIKSPTIIGNILVTNSDPKKPSGTLGNAAPISSLSNNVISPNHILSTLSEMLRVPKITPDIPSLVSVKNDVLIPTIENGRNIDNRT